MRLDLQLALHSGGMKKVWNCFGDSFDSSTWGRINHANGHLRNIYVFPKRGEGSCIFSTERGGGDREKREKSLLSNLRGLANARGGRGGAEWVSYRGKNKNKETRGVGWKKAIATA